jgi:hypothetical protein
MVSQFYREMAARALDEVTAMAGEYAVHRRFGVVGMERVLKS